MTRDEWGQVEQELTRQWSPVYLDCDGYLVALSLQRVSDFKLAITVYVDGWMKGEWLLADRETGEWAEQARRFYQLHQRTLYSPKKVKEFERKCGKKAAAKYGFYEKYHSRRPFWRSVKSLRRHICRENTEIRWLSREEYQQRLDERRQGEPA